MHHRRIRLTSTDVSTAARLLDVADGLLRSAASCVRARFGDAAIDDAQLQLYDLALSRAELAASGSMTTLALRADSTDIERRVACAFCAETLSSFRHRLSVRPADYGMTSADLRPMDDPFVASQLAADELTALGRDLVGASGTLPYRLDDEKRLMRDTFRRFADEVVRPRAAAIHRTDSMIPDEIIEGLRRLGCFGLSIPERFGGLKPDHSEDSLGMILATEELSRGSLGAAGSLITRPEIVARALLEGGTAAQQARWLPALAAGDPFCAVSVTEPGTGSDVAAVSLRAKRVDGGWRLNGGKTWCTFAGKAGVILVLARTDPDVRPLHKGLSLFLVEKPSTDADEFVHHSNGGTVTGRAIATIGYRGMHSFEMFYDEFFVPDTHLVGEQEGEGRGFYFTMRGFSGGRLQTAARACGLMQAAFDSAVAYAQNRTVFDRKVADYPLTQAKFARMGMYIAACRCFSHAVAQEMDKGAGQIEASLVKLLACHLAEWVSREAMQIHGGIGYAEETDVSRLYVDARVLSIFEGAEETLALRVIGKALLESN
ncbi:MAG TPA: acyl-CoA dehydrogenase family protein [Pseudomonadales bacterium]|nr:acyl-CoA dehydrogenase family protein [Pseudomonadales bacterium]